MNPESAIQAEFQPQSKPKSRAGLITVGIFGGLATGIVCVSLPFVWPAFRKVVLPYVPATTTQVENVIQAVKHKRAHLPERNSSSNGNCRVIDLGSGDGRIVSAHFHSPEALSFRFSPIDPSEQFSPLAVWFNVFRVFSLPQVIECAKHGMRSHGVELNPW